MLKNLVLFKSRPFQELPGEKPSAEYHRGEAYYHTLSETQFLKPGLKSEQPL